VDIENENNFENNCINVMAKTPTNVMNKAERNINE